MFSRRPADLLEDLESHETLAVPLGKTGLGVTVVSLDGKGATLRWSGGERYFSLGAGKEDVESGAGGGAAGEVATYPLGKAPVKFSELPKAIQALLRRFAGDAEFTKLERDTKPDGTEFKAEWFVDGRKQEAKISADGTAYELKQDLDSSQLPDSVAGTARQSIPDLSGAESRRVTRTLDGESVTQYEVKGHANGAKQHVVIADDGTLLERKGKGKG